MLGPFEAENTGERAPKWRCPAKVQRLQRCHPVKVSQTRVGDVVAHETEMTDIQPIQCRSPRSDTSVLSKDELF